MIRVLLVDDSRIALHILQRLLAQASGIMVVGTASNGREALDLIPALDPDVICTDLHMPVMDGLEFTRAVMDRHPRPILVVSVSVDPDSANLFRLLEAGAVDVLQKPRDIQDADNAEMARELASKVRIVAGVHVFRRALGARVQSPPALAPMPRGKALVVAIGASTGGPQALRKILGQLPADYPLPLLCVQHIGGGFLNGMVAWLAEVCPLPVRVASAGEAPPPGVVSFAPEDAHLDLDQSGQVVFARTAPCDGHRPSATVTLSAVARQYGAGAVGVLLTGMGRDGAAGMAAIAAADGMTLAQDEASSVVWGMPGSAIALGAARRVLPLEQIAPALIALATTKGKDST